MYKLLKSSIPNTPDCIIRVSDNTSIPFDPANNDYQAYLKWLEGYELSSEGWVKTSDGNTPLPADEEQQ